MHSIPAEKMLLFSHVLRVKMITNTTYIRWGSFKKTTEQ